MKCEPQGFKYGIYFVFSFFVSVCEHQKVLKGLLNLSINLLSIGGVKGREEITEKIWRLGRHVFVSLVKTHTHIARSALKTLCDRIITGNSLTQFTGEFCHIFCR